MRVSNYIRIIILIPEPFEETEEKWLSSLENTRWLEYVRFVQLLSFSLNLLWNNYRVTGGAKVLQSHALLTSPPVAMAHISRVWLSNRETDSSTNYSSYPVSPVYTCSHVCFCAVLPCVDSRDHQHRQDAELLCHQGSHPQPQHFHPHPLGTTDLFPVSIVWWCQECHVNQQRLMNFPDIKIKLYSVDESYKYWKNSKRL